MYKRLIVTAVLTILVVLAGLASVTIRSAHAADGEDTLYSGQTLISDQKLPNQSHSDNLIMQSDGNLVEYDSYSHPLWASGTVGHPGTILINQSDGNMVLVAPGNIPIWSTNTSGHPGTVLTIQNDANIVAYAPGHTAIWASGSNSNSGELTSTQQRIVSIAQAIMNGQAEPGWGGGAVPYVWGGGHSNRPGPSIGTCEGYTGSIQPCPANRTVGVDCSGFVRWVYNLAFGVDVLGSGGTNSEIPRLQRVSISIAQPGDLVFYGASTSNTHHVGIYVGNGKMINALKTGTNVEIDNVNVMSDLVGYFHYNG